MNYAGRFIRAVRAGLGPRSARLVAEREGDQTDELDSFLRERADYVSLLRTRWMATREPKAYVEWVTAKATYERTRREVVGVPCPYCDIHGEVAVGPDGTDVAQCPCCHADGWVLPEEVERFAHLED